MNIQDLLTPANIKADMKAPGKVEAIEELVELLVEKHSELDRAAIVKNVLEREKLGSTGIGNGVAIPHCKLNNIDEILCCFGRSRKGIDFKSVDYQPAHLFFLLLAPENAAGEHLKALATISRLCQSAAFRARLMEAESEEDIFNIMREEDQN